MDCFGIDFMDSWDDCIFFSHTFCILINSLPTKVLDLPKLKKKKYHGSDFKISDKTGEKRKKKYKTMVIRAFFLFLEVFF